MHLIGKKIFDSKVGFLRGAQFSGGVTFEVWLHYLASNVNQHRKLTSIWTKSYGKIQELKNNFPTDVPADFSIELRVNADDDSMSDWATWVSPVITTKVLQPKFKIKLIPIDSAIKVESIN